MPDFYEDIERRTFAFLGHGQRTNGWCPLAESIGPSMTLSGRAPVMRAWSERGGAARPKPATDADTLRVSGNAPRVRSHRADRPKGFFTFPRHAIG